MTQEPAIKPDREYFLGLERGAERRFYLASSEIPSFTWIHDRVEGDLIYGRIEFAGHPGQYPLQPHLYDRGPCVVMACSALFKSKNDDQKTVSVNENSRIFLSPPLPSQYPLPSKFVPDFNTVGISRSELGVLDRVQERLKESGFKMKENYGGFYLSHSYVRRQQKGCLDFTFSKESLVASIMLRKHKPKGFFSRAVWTLRISDGSHRKVQPNGPRPGELRVSPGGTSILSRDDLESVQAVADALIDSIDRLVARNL